MRKLVVVLVVSAVFLTGCVSSKKYYEQVGLRQATEQREENLVNKLVIFNRTIGQLEQSIAQLQQDSLNLERSIEAAYQEHKTLQATIREMNQNARSTNEQLSTQLQEERTARRELEEQRNQMVAATDKWRSEIAALEAYCRQQTSVIANSQTKLIDDGVRIIIPEEELFARATHTKLSRKGTETLAPIAEILKRYPQVSASVQGHTDSQSQSSASSKWNFTNSRAISVTSALEEEYGVNATQLEPTAKSDHAPLTSNSNADGRQQNRRVEVVLRFRTGDLLRGLGL